MGLKLDLNKDRKGEGAFGLRRRIPFRKLEQQCKAHTVVWCVLRPVCRSVMVRLVTVTQYLKRIKFLSLKPALAMFPRLA